jgi:hypothetical protein
LQIKVISFKYEQSSTIVEKSTGVYPANRPDSRKELVPDETNETVKYFDSNKLIEKKSSASAFNIDEALLHSNIPVKNPGSVRSIFINKYIKAQENYSLPDHSPVVEMKI